MLVEVYRRNEEELEENEDRDAMSIVIDGEKFFDVHDGEPEDNNLCRNFNDCLRIPALMLAAYEVGKRGGSFETARVADYEMSYPIPCGKIEDLI